MLNYGTAPQYHRADDTPLKPSWTVPVDSHLSQQNIRLQLIQLFKGVIEREEMSLARIESMVEFILTGKTS